MFAVKLMIIFPLITSIISSYQAIHIQMLCENLAPDGFVENITRKGLYLYSDVLNLSSNVLVFYLKHPRFEPSMHTR
ncbi:hypothetical protein HanHA300_Chr03g0090271 [Helianthus annuus]|nr:hypothetical protein HanHA300_Chr03g0090271 [Helianthus annuus]KAJ0607858.1 hypothetical protein HanHA89_Chr03g0101901 [Helianthus annuus]KAJ0767922.1 hypothetical protein HanLR1_Chr03g0095271 [Helianthus annuus]